MCGRFTQLSSISTVIKEFGIDEVSCDFRAHYNIAPGQNVAAIVENGTRKLIELRWGLVPSWAKDINIGYKMINARADTIIEKVSFKKAFEKRRCIIFTDGFYEWHKDGKVKKPFFLFLKSGKPFGLAGLHEKWISPEGEEVKTCAIITTESNNLIKPIHNRMPVILSSQNEKIWLDCKYYDKESLLLCLKAYDSKKMQSIEVSTYVNSSKNNSPRCIEPISLLPT